MNERFNLAKIQPAAYKAMSGLHQYTMATPVDHLQQELIRIRTSQINGCAYCVHKHTTDARRQGESEQRMHLVSVWKEAGPVFSEEERLLLGMTEAITLVHQEGLSDRLFEKAIELWGEEKTAQVIMIITEINAWNRIGVALKMEPDMNY